MCTVLGVQEAGDRAEAGLCHGAGQGGSKRRPAGSPAPRHWAPVAVPTLGQGSAPAWLGLGAGITCASGSCSQNSLLGDSRHDMGTKAGAPWGSLLSLLPRNSGMAGWGPGTGTGLFVTRFLATYGPPRGRGGWCRMLGAAPELHHLLLVRLPGALQLPGPNSGTLR